MSSKSIFRFKYIILACLCVQIYIFKNTTAQLTNLPAEIIAATQQFQQTPSQNQAMGNIGSAAVNLASAIALNSINSGLSVGPGRFSSVLRKRSIVRPITSGVVVKNFRNKDGKRKFILKTVSTSSFKRL